MLEWRRLFLVLFLVLLLFLFLLHINRAPSSSFAASRAQLSANRHDSDQYMGKKIEKTTETMVTTTAETSKPTLRRAYGVTMKVMRVMKRKMKQGATTTPMTTSKMTFRHINTEGNCGPVKPINWRQLLSLSSVKTLVFLETPQLAHRLKNLYINIANNI